jgi:LDH2 family malate/lactate/ureidoglycolate dehydrogenase
MNRVDAKAVNDFLVEGFVSIGLEHDYAKVIADGLIHASLRGVDSHGVRLFPHYIESFKQGRLNVNPDYKISKKYNIAGTMDADHAQGHAAGFKAIHIAIQMAEENGIGFVSCKNSSHCGALSYFALEASKYDMIGIAMTHATPKMKTPNSNRAFFGTNPICIAAPMKDEGPLCYDSAPTLFSFNKVRQYREQKKELPENVGADIDGLMTNDPILATQLLPIGDYKGFGLSMVVDMFCSLLSSMPFGNDVSNMFDDNLSEKRFLGQFYGAIKIDAFENPDKFKMRLQSMVDKVRQEPKLELDKPIYVPGDPEKHYFQDRIKNGIPLEEAVLKSFESMASSLKIEMFLI